MVTRRSRRKFSPNSFRACAPSLQPSAAKCNTVESAVLSGFFGLARRSCAEDSAHYSSFKRLQFCTDLA